MERKWNAFRNAFRTPSGRVPNAFSVRLFLSTVTDINNHLRPISLTPFLSKSAKDFVVERHLKPAVLARINKSQFGSIPNSSTKLALISMLHSWNKTTDGNGSTNRVMLFDFRKAFDMIDHLILSDKLTNYDIPKTILHWILDFITGRSQRVKLSDACVSEWKPYRKASRRGQN
jgi:hypothetical protein